MPPTKQIHIRQHKNHSIVLVDSSIEQPIGLEGQLIAVDSIPDEELDKNNLCKMFLVISNGLVKKFRVSHSLVNETVFLIFGDKKGGQ